MTTSHSPCAMRLVRLRDAAWPSCDPVRRPTRHAQGCEQRLRAFVMLPGPAPPWAPSAPPAHPACTRQVASRRRPWPSCRSPRLPAPAGPWAASSAQIARHFIECALLRAGGRKGQQFPKILDVCHRRSASCTPVACIRSATGRAPPDRAAVPQRRCAAAPRRAPRGCPGKWALQQGEVALAQAVAPPQALRQFVRPLARGPSPAPRATASPHGAAGARRRMALVHGHESPAPVRWWGETNLQRPPAQSPPCRTAAAPGPGMQLFFQPGLIVPDGDQASPCRR